MFYLIEFGIACGVACCVSELLNRSEFDLLYGLAAVGGMVLGPALLDYLSIVSRTSAGSDWAANHPYGTAFICALLGSLLYGGARSMAGIRGLALGEAPRQSFVSGRVAVTRAKLANRARSVASVVAATQNGPRPSFGDKRNPRR